MDFTELSWLNQSHPQLYAFHLLDHRRIPCRKWEKGRVETSWNAWELLSATSNALSSAFKNYDLYWFIIFIGINQSIGQISCSSHFVHTNGAKALLQHKHWSKSFFGKITQHAKSSSINWRTQHHSTSLANHSKFGSKQVLRLDTNTTIRQATQWQEPSKEHKTVFGCMGPVSTYRKLACHSASHKNQLAIGIIITSGMVHK